MSRPQKTKFRLKPRVMDALFLVGGIVIGEAIAFLTKNIGFLKWLSYDVAFGFEKPIEFTLVIFKFAIGFSIHLNPAVILFALLAFFGGRYLLTTAKQPKNTLSSAYEDEDEDEYEDDEQ